jgi:hypothetical protein
MFSPGGGMVGAVEYDVMFRVATRPLVGLRARRARTCGDVFGTRTKAVRIVRIKTVCDSNTEKGGCDKAVAHGDGALYSRRGFIALGRGTGDVGGVVGWGIIREDSFPHRLFWWGVVIKKGVPRPIIRSIGYLRLSAPAVRLIP